MNYQFCIIWLSDVSSKNCLATAIPATETLLTKFFNFCSYCNCVKKSFYNLCTDFNILQKTSYNISVHSTIILQFILFVENGQYFSKSPSLWNFSFFFETVGCSLHFEFILGLWLTGICKKAMLSITLWRLHLYVLWHGHKDASTIIQKVV